MNFGYIKNWDESKGYGFITSEQGDDFFVHVSDLDITLKPQMIREGMRVKFDIRSDMKGDKAIRVAKA
ncbi:cold shock domain-containing protein [candidate division KSB1 bacterium]|nr:cold shock domain-containing protein [candidate division KSB1 bacterium]